MSLFILYDLQVRPDANPEEPPTSVCESSTSDEPLFILSLTEVLPTLSEGAGLETDPLPLPATSGLLSEPIRWDLNTHQQHRQQHTLQ